MLWLRLGSVFMILAVALGAFGAHALRHRLPADLLSVYETGVRYHVYHALGLFAVAWLAERSPGPYVSGAGWAFSAGIVIFSGSLYLLSLSGVRWLGAVTPLGGLAFLVGWAFLFLASFR